VRLDGSPAAANMIARKRAVFHGALGYAVEPGRLPLGPAVPEAACDRPAHRGRFGLVG